MVKARLFSWPTQNLGSFSETGQLKLWGAVGHRAFPPLVPGSSKDPQTQYPIPSEDKWDLDTTALSSFCMY